MIKEYWRDYADNTTEFLPIYLTNDIIRYWKVLCLNYEAATRDRDLGKRHLQNFKLKHSRLLTCYSAVLWLGALLRARNTVTPDDAKKLAALTPVDRLCELPSFLPAVDAEAAEKAIEHILNLYCGFLEATNAPKEELLARFADVEYYRARKDEARRFGSGIFDLVLRVVEPTELFRYLVV